MYLPWSRTLSTALSRSISQKTSPAKRGAVGWPTTGTGANAAATWVGAGKSRLPWSSNQVRHLPWGDQESGIIQHIWLTCFPAHWRSLIFRIYWDDEEYPRWRPCRGLFLQRMV